MPSPTTELRSGFEVERKSHALLITSLSWFRSYFSNQLKSQKDRFLEMLFNFGLFSFTLRNPLVYFHLLCEIVFIL